MWRSLPPTLWSWPCPRYREYELSIAPELSRWRSRRYPQLPKRRDAGASSRRTKSDRSDSRFPSCDVRCRAVHGLKHGWKFLFWIEIRGGGNANRSNNGGTQVGKNVTEKIGAHDNIKPIRVAHKVSG